MEWLAQLCLLVQLLCMVACGDVYICLDGICLGSCTYGEEVRSQSEVIFLFAGLGLMLFVFLTLVVLLYVAYFRMSEMLRHLSNSPVAMVRRDVMGWDPIVRYFAIVRIAAVLVFSRKSLENGELDLQDYLSFPVSLMKIIKLSFGVMLILSVIVMGYVLVGRYMGG
ncbi:hypothetical protein [Pseudomonas sp. NPDC089569]|uniref:hypothetical protein n=1 Tax=Pseudomonas sp. NPDC089569 TaxID=3390722 RepID=UPI003D0495B1